MTFEGIVLGPNDLPTQGAVVVSSAGGKALTDLDGSYHLETRVPLEADRVWITAVGAGRTFVASVSVGVSTSSGFVRVGPLRLAQGNTCQLAWLPTFGEIPGTTVNGEVRALAVYDDGSGAALYVGGVFSRAGSSYAPHIAKWDGSRWAPVGPGLGLDDVNALAVYDDGSGGALYAGGDFNNAGGVPASGIAKWDGISWEPLGLGVGGTDPTVYTLTVYDDGSGPVLYVGGGFTTAGAVVANRIAKWNGSDWSALDGSGGTSGTVRALAVYDDGGGPALVIGGFFTTAGGLPAKQIAKWDGSTWSALGSGMTGGGILALQVHDDGGGPELYAGGSFTTAGGLTANKIAKWDGSSWSALGSGMDDRVLALTVFDDGGGPALYAGGFFASAGGTGTGSVAKWDGQSWSSIGGPVQSSPFVRALTVFDASGESGLYAGGEFAYAGGLSALNIAQWNGSSWSALGNGMVGDAFALTVFDEGNGLALYAGGEFVSVGGVVANRIAKWNGSNWSALGTEIGDSILRIHALTVFDDGNGPALYAGGYFSTLGGVAVSHIAKWNGSSWSALGNGGPTSTVYALAVFDDGGGPALYAGGLFSARLLKWDGSGWSTLGSGLDERVYALTVFDDGGGPALYAGGLFGSAGGAAANRVAKWDGSNWTSLGSGISGSWVKTLTAYDDGSGPALFAGGFFHSAGGVGANRVAKWDGSNWSALNSGANAEVEALAVFDDGSGPALYAGGNFSVVGGSAASRIARWDGSSWSALGSGIGGLVRALTVFDDGSGPALIAGGAFSSTYDSGDSYLARWGCDTTAPTLACPTSVVAAERFGSPFGATVTFSVTATDEVDPAPVVVCQPASGTFFPRGTTLVTCTATDASGNESTCQFRVIVEPKARRF